MDAIKNEKNNISALLKQEYKAVEQYILEMGQIQQNKKDLSTEINTLHHKSKELNSQLNTIQNSLNLKKNQMRLAENREVQLRQKISNSTHHQRNYLNQIRGYDNQISNLSSSANSRTNYRK